MEGRVTKYNGKKALVMGDSLTKTGIWQKKLTELLGFEVATQARGGSGFLQIVDGDPEGFVHPEALMHRLGPDDVRNVELIVYFAGYNCRQMPYGEEADLYPGQKTVRGCIQYVINRIYEELAAADNLTCKLLFVTPHCHGLYSWSTLNGYEESPDGMSTRKMGEVIAEVCANNNIPVCNLWEESGINRFNWCVFGRQPFVENTDYTKYELDEKGNVIGTEPLKYERGKTYIQIRDGKPTPELYETGGAYPYLADQLHCSRAGYERIGECIVGSIIKHYGI